MAEFDQQEDIAKKVRSLMDEAQKKGVPFGMIVTTPTSYSAGIKVSHCSERYMRDTDRYLQDKNQTFVYFFTAFAEMLLQYVEPHELRKAVNHYMDMYQVDNADKFLGGEDGTQSV